MSPVLRNRHPNRRQQCWRCRVLLGLAAVILLMRDFTVDSQLLAQGESGGSPEQGVPISVPADLLVRNVNLVPMDSPRVLREQAILVRNGLIHEIGPPDTLVWSADARVIDGEGGYLLPGLTDAHVHVHEAQGGRPDFGDAPIFFAAGITSVLNLMGNETSLEWRRRIEEGAVIAPTLYTSGEFVNEPFVTSPEEVAEEIARQARAGYDVIKFHEIFFPPQPTTVGLSRESYDRMIRAAKDWGIPLLGHTPHNLKLEAVLEEGQSLAHLNALLEHDLLPDPSPRFQSYARTTKWSCLILIAFATAATFWALARGDKGFSSTVISLASIALSGFLFLYVWEETYWAGSDRLILLLNGLGLSLFFLAAICAVAVFRRGNPTWYRVSALALLLPLTALLFSLSFWLPLTWRTSDRQLDELAAALKASGVSVVTTLVVDSGVTHEQFEPWFRYLSKEARWIAEQLPVGQPPFFEPNLEVTRWSRLEKTLTKKLQHAGVPLLAGTDAMGYPLMVAGISLQRELELLLESGLTPYEVLRTATAAPAAFLGRESEFGRIAVGMRADLLLVDANPLEELDTLREPQGLAVRGRWFSKRQLDHMLEGLASQDRD